MKRPSTYNTRQRDAVYNYIASLNGAHVTCAQIMEHFEQQNAPIGRATIYRHLDKLTEAGKIRRYITDGVSGACYQIADGTEGCPDHLHLKCDGCGELQHIENGELDGIRRHILDGYAFSVDGAKTVLYGKCANCLKIG